MDTGPMPAILSLDELVAELRRVFSFPRVSSDYVRALLNAYKSQPKDWTKYAMFDTTRYTRNLVDAGNGKYNLIILCWSVGQASQVHDHSDSHCFVKILSGELTEVRYAFPPDGDLATNVDDDSDDEKIFAPTPLQKTMVKVYPTDGVTYINDLLGLHRMENASKTEGTVSLHLYTPPFDFCHIYDRRNGKSNRATMTYWSQYGVRTPLTETSLNRKRKTDNSTEIIFNARYRFPMDQLDSDRF